jgi:uncharacterized protein DUF5667
VSAVSDPQFSADHEPTRALLLAQALETCICAEWRVPGSAEQIIARQPAWARGELRRLVALAGSLDAAATGALMSEEFRIGARARLMHRIAPNLAERHVARNGHARLAEGLWLTTLPSRNEHRVVRRRGTRWLWRGGLGGLLAAVLVAAATLTASASALPGDALYGVKQVREELGVRFAPSDDARALALLQAANTRLDETTRLLQQGRTDQVSQATQEYDDALNQATLTYVVTIAAATPTDPTADTIQSTLTQQQAQLQTLLQSAPEPARADLREALVAAERTRALVADPKPGESRASVPSSVAAAPTVAPEVEPEPTTVAAPSAPPPVDIVAPPTSAPIADTRERHEGSDAAKRHGAETIEAPTAVVVRSAPPAARPVVTTRPATVSSSRRQEVQLEDVQVPDTAQVADAPDVTASGHAADVKSSDGEDHVVAPSLNQDDTRGRVAEQSSTPVQAAVAQPQSSDGASTARTEQAQVVAQSSSQSGNSHAASHDGGDTAAQPVAEASPTPAVTRAQSTSGSSDSRRSSGADSSSAGNFRSGGSTSNQSSSSGGGEHDGGDGGGTHGH